MKSKFRAIFVVSMAAIACCIAPAGCRTISRTPVDKPPVMDQCADRLHDIAGHLLFYYSREGHLPDDLATLREQTPGPEKVPPFTCPISGEPYIYHRAGASVDGLRGELLAYDSEPVHDGRRWALVMNRPPERGSGPRDIRVVALPRGWEPSAKDAME